MDSNSDFEPGVKSQQEQSKLHKKEEVAEEMGRISDLPDHVIAQVLSFLKTEEAIRTCILSSRWRYIWKGIPRISLDGLNSDPDNFLNLVEHALKNCSSTIFLAFELYFSNATDITRLNQLIRCIFRCNFEELTIYVGGLKIGSFLYPRYPVPKCILSCTTLRVLKLDYFDIQIPDSIVSFPHLQSIDIGLIYPNFDAVQRLLCCCPVLQELFLFGYIDSLERQTFDISVSTLRRLRLWMRSEDGDKEDKCEIIINTPHLKYLSIKNYSYAQYVVKNQLKLENVVVKYKGVPEGPLVPDIVHHLLRLLTGISATESLNLRCQTLDVLVSALDYTWPTFPHLKKLIMKFSIRSGWACFSKMLYSTPCLEFLSLNLEEISRGLLGQKTYEWTLSDSIPNCVLKHLKVIAIQYFIGMKDILQVVEYLLSNAQVLELMVIDFRVNIMDEEALKKLFPEVSRTCYMQIKEVAKKLQMFPKVSQTCYMQPEEVAKKLLMFPKASQNCYIQINSPQN